MTIDIAVYMQLPPSDFIYIAIENGTFIVDLPIKNCDFHSYYYILGQIIVIH